MRLWTRYNLFAVTILTVLTLSAIKTAPVYADDNVPPPTESTDIAPVMIEPATDDEPVVNEAVEPVVEETVQVEESIAEILAQVPEGIELIVVDEKGEVLPLASVEAATAIIHGDPIWCPVGVVPGGAGCSPPFTNFGSLASGLINSLDTMDPAKAGVIWVAYDYNAWNSEPLTTITLNGDNFANLDNFALTIQGGWNGILGSTALNTTAPYSTFNQTLSIINWTGNITLKNLNFTMHDYGSNISDQALEISTKGTITLDTVNVIDNNMAAAGGVYNGASLNNTSGTGTVTIKNSSFNNNEGYGLDIQSKGAITFIEISANTNGTYGVTANNHLATTAQPVTLTGTNVFSENTTNGLVVNSRGAISASNLVANANPNGWGIILDNTYATTAQPVKLTGANEFKFNSGGLWIMSKGAITTNNLTVSNNLGTDGARLWNDYVFASNVTMTGTNVFNSNYSDGLEVWSLGTITLNNITANGNGLSNTSGVGTYLNNRFASTPKAVIVNGTNTFNNNYSGGLEIDSKGAVTLSRVTANGNKNGYGAWVFNTYGSHLTPQNVTLTIANTFNNNYASGLIVDSYGVITIVNLTASFNGTGPGSGLGASLINNYGTVAKAVILSGNNTFSGNDGTGLRILSLGAITLNNVRADSNTNFGYGAYLNNAQFGAVGGVTINNTPAYFPSFSYNQNTGLQIFSFGNIIIKDIDAYGNSGNGIYLNNTAGTGNISVGTMRANWINLLADNALSGLEVYSNGTVTLSNIYARDNASYGTLIHNQTAASPKAVVINGSSNYFNGNVSGGLKIITKGAITINNISANNNHNEQYTAGGIGVQLDNTASTTALPQNVTINGRNSFSGNFLSGLQVSTYGVILMNNLIANSNGGYGALINNETAASPKAVTINGSNNFNFNVSGGLYIFTKGMITLSNVSASNNTSGKGAQLNNLLSGVGAPQNITLSGTNDFSFNFLTGLDVDTYGAITINSLSAYSNGGFGADLNNLQNHTISPAITPKGVTLNGTNNFSSNQTGGLKVFSLGTIKVSNLDASSNSGYGAYLDNEWSGAIGSVSITGYAITDYNDSFGLQVFSFTAITIANLDAWGNDEFGAYIRNSGGSGGVTITGNNNWAGSNNNGNGLEIHTKGAVTISNLYASFNALSGAIINNTYSGFATPQNVTLSGSNYFYQNDDDGLRVTTYGMILLSNIDAWDNGDGPSNTTGWGAWLDNCGYNIGLSDCTSTGAPKGITITGTNYFESNSKDGLWATSFGSITISNLTASYNIGNGASLDNQWGPGSVGGISLTGTNIFERNGANGLHALSHGAITLSNISANFNINNNGVNLDNYSLTSKGVTVTLTGTNTFLNNGWSGLEIVSDGQITLSNVLAEGNVASGAYLNNWFYSTITNKPGIKLAGINTFNGNGEYGLFLDSYGVIDLNWVTADLNGSTGLFADTLGNFTLACGSMNKNGEYGWFIDAAPGVITLKGVYGFGNTSGNYNTLPQNIMRTCPTPVPPVVVVSPPKEDEDGKVGGGSNKDAYEKT